MGEKTGIAWTDATWNPVTGCSKVSAGCKHCYAERVFPRAYHGQTVRTVEVEEVPNGVIGRERTRPRRFTDVQTHPERLDQPQRWRKPRRIFVNSMSDLFHEDVPYEFVREVFNVMRTATQHTFQVLTKRPERMLDFALTRKLGYDPNLPIGHISGIPPNVWLGVSAEDQATWDERVPMLMATPAAVRFVSAEPLLGPIDVFSHSAYNDIGDGELVWKGPDWVIVGGESGPKARPFDLAWARSILRQCRDAGVPVFVKQLGARPVFGVDHRGGDGLDVRVIGPTSQHSLPIRHRAGAALDEWPADLQVQEWPS